MTNLSFNRLADLNLVDRVCFLDETPSTNTSALALVRDLPDLPDRVLLLTQNQTAGRGRFEHTWWSSERTLTFSILVRWSRLGLRRDQSNLLSEKIGLLLQSAVQDHLVRSGSDVAPLRVKLPNDLYFGNQKLAGILIESPNREFVVIGIGLNLNNSEDEFPPSLAGKITSIRCLTGKAASPEDFLEQFLIRFNQECPFVPRS